MQIIIKTTLKILFIGTVVLGSICYGAVDHTKDKIRVAFINPDLKGNTFWDEVTDFMKVVADDLGIQLQVYYCNKNRFDSIKFAEEVIDSKKIDYLMYIYQVHKGKQILEIAEKAKIKSFIFNTNILPSEQNDVGAPREKFSYWIGHMISDDVKAGYDLATHLIQEARNKKMYDKDKIIHLVGITGFRDSSAAYDRHSGLLKAVKHNPDVKLHQVVFTDWDSADAKMKAKFLLKRYPKTKVIWSASDDIAMGVIKGLADTRKIAGKDFLTGGIDWTSEAISNVDAGKMVTSIGGHFMQGGWSLVLLYDYHHGVDFSSSGTIIRPKMRAITKSNIRTYYSKSKSSNWKNIDFRKFSKVLNPKLKKYNFDLLGAN